MYSLVYSYKTIVSICFNMEYLLELKYITLFTDFHVENVFVCLIV